MKSIKNSVARNLKIVCATICFLLTVTIGFSQDPGGGPDGPPPAVPFDDYLYLILGAVGIVLTYVTLRKFMKKVA